MTILVEGLDALRVQERTVAEVARICHVDGSIEAIQLVFDDDFSLTLTVWTDWRLVAELRSGTVMPDYLWPPGEWTQSVIDGLTGLVEEAEPRHNEVGELVEAHFTIGNRRLQARSYAGNFVIDLP